MHRCIVLAPPISNQRQRTAWAAVHPQLLLLECRHLNTEEVGDVLWRADRRPLLREERGQAPSQLQRCFHAHGLGVADPAHPRQLRHVETKEAPQPALVRQQAIAIVAVHNHPSGDPTPSAADVALTVEIVAAGQLLDIELLDHLIIGQGRWLSLKRLGLGFPKT